MDRESLIFLVVVFAVFFYNCYTSAKQEQEYSNTRTGCKNNNKKAV
jgi:hypothetical protein